MSKVSKSLQYQRSIVKNLCSQTISGKYSSEIAASVDDYENDPRVFLGILSFPDENCKKCLMEMRKELSKCFEEDYVLPPRAWHLTIRNIRTISNPPNFSKNDISNLISELDEKIKNIKPIRFSFKDFLYTPTSIGIAAYPDENFVFNLTKVMFENNGIPFLYFLSSSKFIFSKTSFITLLKSLKFSSG
jgi:hypothetical protein